MYYSHQEGGVNYYVTGSSGNPVTAGGLSASVATAGSGPSVVARTPGGHVLVGGHLIVGGPGIHGFTHGPGIHGFTHGPGIHGFAHGAVLVGGNTNRQIVLINGIPYMIA
jgi:hypothetical protein